jgi:hypothetical protein
VTRTEALSAAHKVAAHAIRHHIDGAYRGFAADWDDSEDIRTTLEQLELSHITAAQRLTATAARETA